MFDSLQSFFRDRVAPAQDVDEDALRLRVATAGLLLEAAHADDEFSADEEQAIEAMLGRRFGLDESATAELIAVAQQERNRSDDLFEFAQLINDRFPTERKLAIVQLLWEVVYEDGILEAHEDVLMHKIGRLLGVRHEQLMALKVQVKRSRGD